MPPGQSTGALLTWVETRKDCPMLSVVLTCVVALAAAGAEDDISALLPADGVPAGWQAGGQVQHFPGDALYRHINGGAELFHANGFVQLVLNDYSKGDLEVRVEIYQMAEPAGAAGVFEANSKGADIGDEYGEACTIDDYQILFRRGRFYVSVTCYDIDEELQAALGTLAGNVDEAIENSD